MAVAFWAYSCTFLTRVSGSPGESAPASTSPVGAGGRGHGAVTPLPVHAPHTLSPVPLLLHQPSPTPYLLPLPVWPCRRARAGATPSWLRREQSTWRGAAGGSPRARGGPDPDPGPFPHQGLPHSPAPGSARRGQPRAPTLYPPPRRPRGCLCKGQGRWGCRGGGPSAETIPADRFAVEGPSSRPGVRKSCGNRSCGGSACVCMRLHVCTCMCTLVCMQPARCPLQGAPW